ncbi:MAG: hypothetical protein ACLQB1_06445 [Streptosporangiaceae bacterium]
MPVTSDQVAALRSYLAGDFSDYEQRRSRIDQSPDRTGYMALVSAAFCEAVERRFTNQDPPERVIEFVADVRAQFDRDGNQIDPRAAERMIRAVYSDEPVDDLDSTTKGRTQIILLAALINSERLDETGLDAFLADASKLASQWLA